MDNEVKINIFNFRLFRFTKYQDNNNNNNNIDFYLAHNHESISMRCTIQISTQINIKIKHTCNIILKLKFIIYVIDKKQKTCIHECCP